MTRTDALLDRVIADLSRVNPQAGANLEYDLAQMEPADVQQFTVVSRGEAIAFTSQLSDDDVHAFLRGSRNSFAQSLLARWGRLSPAQYAWAHKLAIDSTPVATVTTVENSVWQGLFAPFISAAAGGAKRMTLRFDGLTIKPSKDMLALYLTDPNEFEEGRFGPQAKYMGKVTLSGPDSRLPESIKEQLLLIAGDPLSAAIEYGSITGNCSCCGRELTVPASIEAGIGPVCKVKYGL